MRKITLKLYDQPTLQVAQKILGNFLVRQIGDKKIVGRIVETEAYCGFDDRASHASRGITQRNEIMFGPAGRWYVYFIYGNYHCLNIVTEHKGYPAAVLIRALEPISGIDEMKINRNKSELKDLCSGPGKLCQALEISKSLNNTKAFGTDCRLWIEKDGKASMSRIVTAKRIGVDYAGKWADKKWRFYIKGSEFVSRQ